MGRIAAIVVLATLCAGCSAAPGTTSVETPAQTPATSPAPASPTATVAEPTAAFPLAQDLGPGWRLRGRPTPRERDPHEVTALAVPLGCPRHERLPQADHAFEVDYAFEGAPVVAVRLAFARRRRAERFVAARQSDIRACVGRTDSPAIGPYVEQVRGALNDRTPESEPWTELALRIGSDVLLMAAAVSLGEPPFTSPGVARIREALR